MFEYVGASVDLIVPVNIRLAPFLTEFRFIGETKRFVVNLIPRGTVRNDGALKCHEDSNSATPGIRQREETCKH